jgi:small subunit ribosomal protein S12
MCRVRFLINYFNIRNKTKKLKKKNFSRLFYKFNLSPQVRGIVIRLVIRTPKKPNSALRHVAKINLYKNNLQLTSRIPGIGYLPTRYNRVLVRGGRANDLPGVRSTLIRNVYDFAGLYTKRKRRSIYGTPRPENYTKHIRRKYRNIKFL